MYRLSEPKIAGDTLAALQRVVESNYFSSGKEVERFEKEWAEYCGMKYAVACSSGTTAIEMAMEAFSSELGLKVLVPAFTCIPTAVPFVRKGWDVELVDCGADGNITQRTLMDALDDVGEAKVFVPVHIYGNPLPEAVFDYARDKGLFIIEDCAEGHGAYSGGHIAGSNGDIGCFSFRGDKMITTGGCGGAAVTNNADLAEYMHDYSLLFLTKPHDERYDVTGIGNGIQMGELQAAFGRCQVPQLDKMIETRRRLADVYDDQLRQRLIGRMVVPRGDGSVVWRYMIMLDYLTDRAQVIKMLNSEGIEAMASFRSLSELLPPLTGKNYRLCPEAEYIGSHGVCLPMHCNLTEDDIKKICSIVGGVLGER